MAKDLKFCVCILAAVALFGSPSRADEAKELKTQKGKAVVLGDFLNTPSDCSSNPIPSPLAATSREAVSWHHSHADRSGERSSNRPLPSAENSGHSFGVLTEH